MSDSPFFGPSYQLEGRIAGVQRLVNMCLVPLESGNERAQYVLKDTQGLVKVAQTYAPLPPPPPMLFLFDFEGPKLWQGAYGGAAGKNIDPLLALKYSIAAQYNGGSTSSLSNGVIISSSQTAVKGRWTKTATGETFTDTAVPVGFASIGTAAQPIDWGGLNLVPSKTGSWTGGDPQAGTDSAAAKFRDGSIYSSSGSGWTVTIPTGALSSKNLQLDWWSKCANSNTAGGVISRVMFQLTGTSGLKYNMQAPGQGAGPGPSGAILVAAPQSALVIINGQAVVVQNDNVYYHNCLQWKAGVFRYWSNGVKCLEQPALAFDADNTFRFQSNGTGGTWNGWFDEVRGTTRLTDFFTGDTFTPPTSPYVRFEDEPL